MEALAGERICSVSCGARSTAAITASGALLMWGRLSRQGVGDVAVGFDAPEDDRSMELDVTSPILIQGLQVRFRWKNPDFLFKNPDFFLKNVDKTGD